VRCFEDDLLLQPRLNIRVSQRQVLTPGLVQMVGVLALNKLELKEMINGELVENPVLEEIDEAVESIEDRAGREGDRERSAEVLLGEASGEAERKESDPFDEIDFGSYFQDYLDPGYKTASSFEDADKPSFEHFLSQPSTLTDHLLWQLGSLTLSVELRMAAECVVGNLNEDGYLTATLEELAESLVESGELGVGLEDGGAGSLHPTHAQRARMNGPPDSLRMDGVPDSLRTDVSGIEVLALVEQARCVVVGLDPAGIAARDLRECLLAQLAAQRAAQRGEFEPGGGPKAAFLSVLATAETIVGEHLAMLQRKDVREIVRACRRPAEMVQAAIDLIRKLDPRPGQRYNQGQTRLIEPDVAFVKRGEVFVVVMNEDDLPALRLNQSYRKMLREKGTDTDVREYVKERYKSAIQLLRNIEQRKNTIVRTCESIVKRQGEFLERGVEGLRPMMIKDVAEEIGVHPSTVSRAVANKYVHTTQGVYELRFFFSEAVNGPEGGDLPLPLLKRRVKKLIEEEDPRKPLTDEHLAEALQQQGIQVTRRTVAKYREDMQIPSTHQRRSRG
jgi:RNA polymerase sigma-54 factor